MPQEAAEIQYQIDLSRARRVEARRRSCAWAAIPDTILGLDVSPVTPMTLSLLHGTGNGFICGLPPVIADVRNWMLFHSPGFSTDAPVPRYWSRLRVTLRIERALCPLRTARGRREAVTAGNFHRACAEIRAIISETWADSLPPEDRGDTGPTVAASSAAQLVDLFAREYQTWPLATPIRHTPIKQLLQLARCNDRHHLGEKAGYWNAAEEAIVAKEMARENAPDRVAARRMEFAKQFARDFPMAPPIEATE